MKKAALWTAAAFLMSLVTAGVSMAAGEYGKSEQKEKATSGQMSGAMSGAQAQATGQEQIRTANDLQDFTVQDNQGKKIGKVDKVGIDLQHGQIGYVTVSSQGKDLIIPWQALKVEPQQKTLALSNMSADQLKQAPQGKLDKSLTREKEQKIHQFYGVAPYWESTGTQERLQEPGTMQHPGTMQQPGTLEEKGERKGM